MCHFRRKLQDTPTAPCGLRECSFANACDPYGKNIYRCDTVAGVNSVLLLFSFGREGTDGITVYGIANCFVMGCVEVARLAGAWAVGMPAAAVGSDGHCYDLWRACFFVR